MLTSPELFQELIESDDPKEIAKKVKAAMKQRVEGLLSTRFFSNKVPLELIRGKGNGSVWSVMYDLEQAVDEIAELAAEVAKYNRDGSLKEESVSESDETKPEGPPTTPNQP